MYQVYAFSHGKCLIKEFRSISVRVAVIAWGREEIKKKEIQIFDECNQVFGINKGYWIPFCIFVPQFISEIW